MNTIRFVLALALIVWGFTDVRNRGRVDPDDPLAHKTDLTVYTEAGRAFFDGRNPYDVSNPRGWRYLYPPLFAILLAPLAALAPQWQAVVWYFVSLLFALGCWRESRRIWRLGMYAQVPFAYAITIAAGVAHNPRASGPSGLQTSPSIPRRVNRSPKRQACT